MGKYKNLSPDALAEKAFQNYLNAIPKMIEDYTAKMQQIMKNPSMIQEDYVSGVAGWTAAMRNPQVRGKIRDAVNMAKDIYEGRRSANYNVQVIGSTIQTTV